MRFAALHLGHDPCCPVLPQGSGRHMTPVLASPAPVAEPMYGRLAARAAVHLSTLQAVGLGLTPGQLLTGVITSRGLGSALQFAGVTVPLPEHAYADSAGTGRADVVRASENDPQHSLTRQHHYRYMDTWNCHTGYRDCARPSQCLRRTGSLNITRGFSAGIVCTGFHPPITFRWPACTSAAELVRAAE